MVTFLYEGEGEPVTIIFNAERYKIFNEDYRQIGNWDGSYDQDTNVFTLDNYDIVNGDILVDIPFGGWYDSEGLFHEGEP